MSRLVIFLIRIYQRTLSPDHGWLARQLGSGYCRYQPTCSEYMIGSIQSHGLIKGIFLGIARISRCHPWAAFGPDPVLNHHHN